MSEATARVYQRFKACVVCVVVRDSHGDLHRGAAFHIGNGFLATARHVVENFEIVEIVPHHYAHSPVHVKRVHLHPAERVDLAVLETDFSLQHFMTKVHIVEGDGFRDKTDFVPIGGHLDDWVGDELVLSKAVLIGYPPIPRIRSLVAVAVEAEVNAVVDRYDGPHAHFIVSAVPRGGFSGGPVLSEYGFLLGVLTDSLHSGDQPYELGFSSVVSIEPLLVMIDELGLECGVNSALARELFGTGDADGTEDSKHGS